MDGGAKPFPGWKFEPEDVNRGKGETPLFLTGPSGTDMLAKAFVGPAGTGPCGWHNRGPSPLAAAVGSRPRPLVQEAEAAAWQHQPHAQTPRRSLKPDCNGERANPCGWSC